MKRMVIGVVLAVFLVGFGEKPKFSISKEDTIQTYANNPLFKSVVRKIKSASDSDFRTLSGRRLIYQFTGVPESVYGIKTNDLDVLGGTIYLKDPSDAKKGTEIILAIRGKDSFTKLEDRISKLVSSGCQVSEIGESRETICSIENGQEAIFLVVKYESFTDTMFFQYSIYEE